MAEGGSSSDGGDYMNIDPSDPSSPYFLGPDDHPGNVITPVTLNGENYFEWERRMRVALRARNKLGFVDGSIEKPDNKSTDWSAINATVELWILQTIEPEVRDKLPFFDDARSLWKDLKQRYGILCNIRWIELKGLIANCKQTKTMSLTSYFGKLMVLWNELDNYESIIECECGNCSCDIGAKMKKRREEERLHQFLMGVYDEYYADARSNLLLFTNPLPSVNQAFNRLFQLERFQEAARASEQEAVVRGRKLF